MAAPVLSTRLCTVCGDPIPLKRIQAKPNAHECVPCLEKLGDVPKLRRFDEFTNNGEEMVSTIFTQDTRIERQMYKLNNFAAPTQAYEQAVGDDSFLVRDGATSQYEGGSLGQVAEHDSEREVDGLPTALTEAQHDDTIPVRDAAEFLEARYVPIALGVHRRGLEANL